MPILHDNRNMRPDLLNNTVEDVDDIFANADAEMAKQRQKQLFSPKKKSFNWRKRLKQITIVVSILALIFIIFAGIFAAKIAHRTAVSEVKTQVLYEVAKMKNNIAAKDESELTKEDLFMLEVFEILSEEDIANIIETATSVEEIIYFLQNANIDISKYLTADQKLQLEDAMTRYAEGLGTQIEEFEQSIEPEESVAEDNETSTATTIEVSPD